MSEQQQKEFDELAEEYTTLLIRMNNFIAINELDYDEVWDKANQHYDLKGVKDDEKRI